MTQTYFSVRLPNTRFCHSRAGDNPSQIVILSEAKDLATEFNESPDVSFLRRQESILNISISNLFRISYFDIRVYAIYASRATSHYNNPYLFTGRRVDILDSGSLKIQYNRNRYYDYYTGRWLTHDPLGITPETQFFNPFYSIGQYTGGLNLYEYVQSTPGLALDPIGLIDIDLIEVGVWIGLGVSAKINYKTDHKDCCDGKQMIKDGLRKYVVNVEGRAGIGAGVQGKIAGVGFSFIWQGPSIIGRKTSELKNSRCGGPVDTGRACKEFSADLSPGTWGVGIPPVSVSVNIKGEFAIRVCILSERGTIYGTVDGRFNTNVDYTTRVFGIKIERLSNEAEKDQPWTEFKRLKILDIEKMIKKCST